MEHKVSREQFVRLIACLDRQLQADNEFSVLLTEYLQHYTVINSHDKLIDGIIEFTESLFCCCGKISYFVRELDFGRTHKAEGQYYPDANALYDDLTDNQTADR